MKLISLFTALLLVFSVDGSAQTAVHLRCEHLVNPIGVDALQPRLSWKMSAGIRQTGYEVIIGTDSAAVARSSSVKKIEGNDQLVTLSVNTKPFTRYYWKVILWNEKNTRLPASEITWFETGMMNASNWKGFWLSDVYGTNVEEKKAPYFRKSFRTGKKIRSARAYIAAGGLYELSINGKTIGDHRLDPIYTRYDRRTLYVTHDVTSVLQEGNNAIGVLLGNGWYNHQSTAVWNFEHAPWRNRPTFCMDLRITYTDGTVETIITDNSWKTAHGPLLFNSIYTAEHYDFRLEQKDWNTPGFDYSKWNRVYYRTAPSQNLVGQLLVPIRDVEVIRPVSMKKLDNGNYLFDLGRNISGVVQLRVKGNSGTTLRLRHAERLLPDGHTDQSNIDVHYRPVGTADPFQTDVIILSGKQDVFRPRFNYKGFQYVEISSDQPVTLTGADLTGFFTHSDVEPIGRISSSNPVIDKIWFATNNSYLSNLMGYPTDCPQREKNGWTGDAHIASETGLYNFDAQTVYEKWMADHAMNSSRTGFYPPLFPPVDGVTNGATVPTGPARSPLFPGTCTCLPVM
ncbi:MAG: family 78 glycoside hydrolase catalytic domain [Bacteroidota bacterium]